MNITLSAASSSSGKKAGASSPSASNRVEVSSKGVAGLGPALNVVSASPLGAGEEGTIELFFLFLLLLFLDILHSARALDFISLLYSSIGISFDIFA